MTRAQLAKRLNLDRTTIAHLEKNEARAAVTLTSLQRLSEAMECRLVYAVVPKQFRFFEDLRNSKIEEWLQCTRKEKPDPARMFGFKNALGPELWG